MFNKLCVLLTSFFLLLNLSGCGTNKDSLSTVQIPEGEFKAEIIISEDSITVPVNKTKQINIEVKNSSSVTWSSKGENKVNLSYHVLDKNCKRVTWDGLRTSFTTDLNSGETAKLKANIQGPEKAGVYFYDFDLVQEKVSWFGLKKSFKPVRVKVKAE